MARPVWTGTLSFGLVNMAVGLYTATVNRTPRFHQIQRGTADRVRYRRVNERTGEEVAYSDVVRGARTESGGYITVESTELDAVAPGRSRALEISEFVPAGDVEPVYYEKTYYLAPDSRDAAKPYALLRSALQRTGTLGVATLVMHGRQHLAVVGTRHEALTLSTLFFADEVHAPEDVLPALPGTDHFSPREFETALRVLESMSGEWRPEDHTDVHRERVDELIEAKARGMRVKRAGEAPQETRVLDLMEAMRSSIRHDTETTMAAEGRPTTPMGGTPASSTGSERSRAPSKRELLQRARALDIPGRSKMTRAELERAVGEVQQRAERPKKVS